MWPFNTSDCMGRFDCIPIKSSLSMKILHPYKKIQLVETNLFGRLNMVFRYAKTDYKFNNR